MKYFTKDWYMKMQLSNMHLGLSVDDRASTFSEELYLELYDSSKKEFENRNVMSYEKYFNLVRKCDSEMTEEEISNSYVSIINHNISYDWVLNTQIKRFQDNLPKSILDKVKDIRVLGLGYVTLDVYNDIKKFSKDNLLYVEETIKEYNKLEKETFKNISLDFRNESFHDAQINSVIVNDDIEISVDSTGGFIEKNNIIFKNASLVSGNICEDYYWLYDEIYKDNDKYEVHVLTSLEDFSEFIILCDDIILK